MIHVRLADDQLHRLEESFRATDDRRMRDRIQAVLMAHRGRPRQQIADDLGIDRRSVVRWINAFCDRSVAGLAPGKAPGRAGAIPAEMAAEVERWVIEGPASCGLDRANWTHEAIADHLLKSEGIRASRSAVQRFCSGIGIRVYRPTCRYLRGDPAKQERAAADIDELKKKRRRAR